MNSELCRKALEKVGNPNILVNVVSKRVRQLNATGAAGRRPLVTGVETLGVADIALTEIIEEKVGFEAAPEPQAAEPAPRKRRRS